MAEPTPPFHGDREDLMWFVGICEGEACFDLQRNTYPRLRISMTDRDTVGRCASLMDVSVRLSLRRAPSAPTWNAEIQGARAEELMRMVLPYMGARRSQKIAEVLSTAAFRRAEQARKSIPGPAVTRPLGIAKPGTAA